MLQKFMLVPIFIVFSLISTTWAGNQAEIPDVHIGDIWKYRELDGYTNETNIEYSHRIVKLDSNEIVIQLQNKKVNARQLKYYTREWNQTESADVKWEPYNPEYKFPMNVGDSWNQKFRFSKTNGASFSSLVQVKVVAFEKVVVPAGTFDAFKIVRDIETRSTDSDANIIKGHIIAWYAPSAKKLVRAESITFANGRERAKKVDELVEFSIQEKPQK